MLMPRPTGVDSRVDEILENDGGHWFEDPNGVGLGRQRQGERTLPGYETTEAAQTTAPRTISDRESTEIGSQLPARWEHSEFELSGDFVNGQQVIRKRQRVQKWLPRSGRRDS